MLMPTEASIVYVYLTRIGLGSALVGSEVLSRPWHLILQHIHLGMDPYIPSGNPWIYFKKLTAWSLGFFIKFLKVELT